MNKEWSELNKTMQARIKKKDTYKMGIDTFIPMCIISHPHTMLLR